MNCPRCDMPLDPETGRHIDEDGQVMSYREDRIQCRELGPIRPSILDRYQPAPSGISYSGFDIHLTRRA